MGKEMEKTEWNKQTNTKGSNLINNIWSILHAYLYMFRKQVCLLILQMKILQYMNHYVEPESGEL